MVLKVLPLQPEWWMWRTCGGVCEWQHMCAGHGWKIRGFWLKTAIWGCVLKAVTCITLLIVFKVSSVVPAPAWWGGTWEALSHSGPTMLNVFVCGSCSERLTGSKCRSFIACLFWLQIAGKGGKGGATTAMGPFCSLLSPRLRCSVLDEKEDTSLSKC